MLIDLLRSILCPPQPDAIPEEVERPDDIPANPYRVENNRLHTAFGPVPFIPSPSVGGKMGGVKYIIAHYTASGSMAGSVKHFQNPSSKVSAHLLIDRTGAIVQCASFDRIAWHCGASEYDGQQALNRMSIGLEFVNWGKLNHPTKDGKIHSWTGTVIPPDEIVTIDGQPWHNFPAEQLEAGFNAAKAIADAYGIATGLGHSEISTPPGRKIDPGPAFPLDDFKRKIIGSNG